jgi:hypothetical protein
VNTAAFSRLIVAVLLELPAYALESLRTGKTFINVKEGMLQPSSNL